MQRAYRTGQEILSKRERIKIRINNLTVPHNFFTLHSVAGKLFGCNDCLSCQRPYSDLQ